MLTKYIVLCFELEGPSDPLPSILVWRDQVISANMNGRIGVYNLQEEAPEVRLSLDFEYLLWEGVNGIC